MTVTVSTPTGTWRAPRVFDTRWWDADEITMLAEAWHARIAEAVGPGSSPALAVVPPLSGEGFAALLAASACPRPVILLPADPDAWPDLSAVAPELLVVLPPSLQHLSEGTARRGARVMALPPGATASTGAVAFMQAPGFAVLTSGSTGTPKLVYRLTDRVARGAMARADALGVARGTGLLSGVPLSSGQGLVQVMTALCLGGPFGIMPRLDHRAALAMFRRHEFQYWSATPHLVDVLGRCSLDAPTAAPRFCVIASTMSDAIFDAFLQRFGVPLRQTYSSSETGTITVDARPDADVRPGTVGRPVSGVEVAIGDRPDESVPRGTSGRIWVRSAWQMAGYGFPPAVARPGDIEGWWPTSDVGVLAGDGQLRLEGRIDDCIRTRDNRLVSLGVVSEAIRAMSGVRASIVLPLDSRAGASFGAVVQCAPDTTIQELREKLSAALPEWGLPRRIVLVQEWPTLANGKTDRLACQTLLAKSGT